MSGWRLSSMANLTLITVIISLLLSTGFRVVAADTMESFFLDLKEMSQLLEESRQLNIQLKQDIENIKRNQSSMCNSWLIDWLIDWLIGWLVGWLIDWLIDWFIKNKCIECEIWTQQGPIRYPLYGEGSTGNVTRNTFFKQKLYT